jgi:hypothetical protein
MNVLWPRTIALTGLLATVAISLAPSSTRAAEPEPAATAHHMMHLIKLPNGDYTVPMNELIDPAWKGTVVLHGSGLKTIVTVTVHGSNFRTHALELHPGSDCNAFGAGNAVALKPATTGVPSQTIVAIPIGNLKAQDYVVAVRDATARQQRAEACAHL